MNTIGVYTLGCKVNQYETEAVAELFSKAGYKIIPFDRKADVYLINTCSVTGESDRKNRQVIRRAHRQNPESVIVVMGCYAQVASEEVKAIEGVDIVIGTEGRSNLVSMVEDLFNDKNKSYINYDILHQTQYEDLSISHFSEHQRAFIKIQDGCDRFCTYCIIPYSRGHIRSRSLDAIKTELEDLAEAGYKEVVLTGIHLASYGRDLNENISLADAVVLANSIAGIERVRIGSLEPVYVTDESAKILASCSKLCRQFHIALQSGSDKVLSAMNRRYTTAEFAEILNTIKKYMPDSTFTTDIMVGFPGESDADHKDSMNFVRKCGFSKMHVFPYSRRPGTKADEMIDQVPKNIKERRAKEMSELGTLLANEYYESLDGKTEFVLLEETEEINGEKFYVGHGKNYEKVYISETELMMEDELINSIKCVSLSLQNNMLYGKIK